jgi:hypothetical protein
MNGSMFPDHDTLYNGQKYYAIFILKFDLVSAGALTTPFLGSYTGMLISSSQHRQDKHVSRSILFEGMRII